MEENLLLHALHCNLIAHLDTYLLKGLQEKLMLHVCDSCNVAQRYGEKALEMSHYKVLLSINVIVKLLMDKSLTLCH